MSKSVAVVLLLVLATTLVGGGALLVANSGGETGGVSGGITVRDAWTAPNSAVTAVYLTIVNPGEDDRLVEVTSDRAGRVLLMGGDTADVSHESDSATTVELDVPGGRTELHPGGSHLMLEGLTGGLRPGDSFPLRLVFEDAGPLEVPVEIVTWDQAAERSQ